MLQEALSQELKRGSSTSLADDTRAAVMAILSALSQTKDCAALTKAAHSIDTVAKRLAETHNKAEAQEVYAIYVRRLLGRAAQVCKTSSDFRGVRAPLREALVRQTGLTPPIQGSELGAKEVNTAIAQLLVARCQAEQQVAGSSDCPDVRAGYLELCPELTRGPDGASERTRVTNWSRSATASQTDSMSALVPSDCPCPRWSGAYTDRPARLMASATCP